ncbi:hypothetical protein [Microviridae sp.]|nr:hypothetical protein [Microviridae sp.]
MLRSILVWVLRPVVKKILAEVLGLPVNKVEELEAALEALILKLLDKQGPPPSPALLADKAMAQGRQNDRV